MELGGQGERGYAMATLLVGMALMAIFMSAALPAWSQLAQREKEAEYLFRANQYALAVKRFQDKMGGSNSPAPSVDFLVEQKFLRKKYKDPLSGKDFVPVLGNQALPGLNQQPNQNLNGSPFGQQPGQTGRLGQPGAQGPSGQQTQPSQSALATGRSLATDTLRLSASDGDSDSPRPLTAVTSSFKGTALRQFKGQMTTYDQWVVTVYDVPLHLGGRSIGSHLVSGPGTNNLQNQNGRPPQGNGGNPFGNGSTGGNPFSGSGGFGGAGTGGFGGAGSGGFGGGTGGFGAPNQQGTSVFPPPPSSPKPQQ